MNNNDKITPFGRIIRGTSVSQSNIGLRSRLGPISGATGVPFDDTFWGKPFKDTSWAELFHDIAWVDLFHDTSWIVNFNVPLTQRRTRFLDRRVFSTQRPVGRIIEFTLATTASSRQLRTSKKADEKRISKQILSAFGKSVRCITTPPGLRCSTILHEPSCSRHFLVRKFQRQLSWQCQELRRSRQQGRQIPSAHRPFGRIIKFLLTTTTFFGRPQFTRSQSVDSTTLSTRTGGTRITTNSGERGRKSPLIPPMDF